MTAQLVHIYLFKGQLWIDIGHRTEASFWIFEETPKAIERNPTEVGAEIRAALKRSRRGVPTPPASKDLTGPLLKATGARSWSAFAKESKGVAVYCEDGAVHLTPDRRAGRGHFEPIPEKKRTIALDDDNLGEVALAALADAE